MKNKLKIFFYNNRRWIYCLEYIFFSIVLLILVTYVDSRYSDLKEYIPRIFLSSVELAKTVLSSLVSALLTITTFTFSTILTVFTLYHNSFTPRSVENFLDKKITMKVLGIFIGGFVYCLVSLNFMKAGADERLVIAGTFGVIYAIWGAIYFVIFVQNVLDGMSYTNLIEEISEHTESLIKKEIEDRKFEYVNEDEWTKNQVPLYAIKTGYLELINIEKIKKLIEEKDIVFTIVPSIGDFVVQNTIVGYFSTNDIDEETKKEMAEQFTYTEKRIAEEDYKEGIRKITEIATRALSPGINDPNTCIHCIRKICILLSHLATVDQHYHFIKTDKKARIYYTSKTFKETLIEYFTPLLTYGDSDPSIVRALFQGLLLMKVSATPKNKEYIINLADDLYSSCASKFKRELDLELFMDIYQQIITGRVKENKLEIDDMTIKKG